MTTDELLDAQLVDRRAIQHDLARHCQPILARVSERYGSPVRLSVNPTNGVVVVYESDLLAAPAICELTPVEQIELAIHVGRAYAALLRI